MYAIQDGRAKVEDSPRGYAVTVDGLNRGHVPHIKAAYELIADAVALPTYPAR